MFSLVKLVRHQQPLINQIVKSRNVFTEAYFKFPLYERINKQLSIEHERNQTSLRLNVEQTLANPDGKMFTEDLKILLALTKSPEEVDFLLSAVKRYQAQDSTVIFDFNFGPPLAKLLYKLNLTDKMLEVFASEENEYNFDKLSTPRKILMNKLLLAKRYEDVFRVAKLEIATFLARREAFIKNEGDSGQTGGRSGKPGLPSEISNMVGQAALELGTEEALNEAATFFKTLYEYKLALNTKGECALFLLALELDALDLALEIASRERNTRGMQQNLNSLTQNLSIITLAKMGRGDEAFEMFKKISQSKGGYFVYQETVQCMTEFVNETDDSDLKASLDAVVLATQDRVAKLNMRDYVMTPTDEQLNQQNNNNNNNDRFNNNNNNRNYNNNRGQNRRNDRD